MREEKVLAGMKATARDFYDGVRPSIEKQFGTTVYPIELLPHNALVEKLDFVGVDAFIMDDEQEMRGLASRVNYAWFEHNPSFSFRYARWNNHTGNWNYEREYQRKLRISNSTEKQIFPELHVESYSQKKGSGLVTWAYMAKTQDILNYIEANLVKGNGTVKGINGVRVDTPKRDERRLVVSVNVEAVAKACIVKEIRLNN